MPQVFISYSKRDTPAATQILDALEAQKIECWIASRNIPAGANFDSEIIKAIRQCPVAVLVFSRHANESPHVHNEVERSVRYRCILIPYRIEDVQPCDVLEYFISRPQWLNAYPPHEKDALHRLCTTVKDWLKRPRRRVDFSEDDDMGIDESTPGIGVLCRLAEEMYQWKKSTVPQESFSKEEQILMERQMERGLVRECHNAEKPASQLVSPTTQSLSEQLWATWIGRNPTLTARELLLNAEVLKTLAEGLGRFWERRFEDRPPRLLSDCIRQEGSAVERAVASLCRRLSEQPERLEEIERIIFSEGTMSAVRGIVLGAQHIIELGCLGVADRMLQGVLDWGKAQSRDSSHLRFLAGVGNEQGRVWRRQGRLEAAENRYRRLLADAESDRTLAGIVRNNLARVILDSSGGSKERRREAILLLEENVALLKEPEQRNHLAVTYNNLGDAYSRTDPEKARFYFNLDLKTCRDLNDTPGTIDAMDRLAVFLSDREQYDEAEKLHNEELELCRQSCDIRRYVRALSNLGHTYFKKSMSLLREEAHSCRLKAYDTLKECAKLCSSVRDPRVIATALENLGRVEYSLGYRVEGIQTLRRAIEHYRQWPQGVPIAVSIEQELNALG